MPTDMQYKDCLRKDKFLNDLIIEAIKNNDRGCLLVLPGNTCWIGKININWQEEEKCILL